MNDGDLLLRAILANPAEDTPRLMYADWLDENGQPERAEFIRVQCELPNLTRTERYETLKRREHELLHANSHIWLFDLPPEFRPFLTLSIVQMYRRGFVEYVSGRAAFWVEHGDAISAAHPIQRVRLVSWPFWESDGEEAWFENDPQQRRIPLVTIHTQATEEEVSTNNLLPALFRCRYKGIAVELPSRSFTLGGIANAVIEDDEETTLAPR